jgi:hypothetical protein
MLSRDMSRNGILDGLEHLAEAGDCAQNPQLDWCEPLWQD